MSESTVTKRRNIKRVLDCNGDTCVINVAEPKDEVTEIVNEPVVSISQDEFTDIAFAGRDGYVTGDADAFSVVLNDHGREFEVMYITKTKDGHYAVSMFPDVYTFSEFTDHYTDISFDLSAQRSVYVVTDFTDIGQVFALTGPAVNSLNLYGYTIENKEE